MNVKSESEVAQSCLGGAEALLWMPGDPPPAPDPDRIKTPAQSPFLLSQAVTDQRGDVITLLCS